MPTPIIEFSNDYVPIDGRVPYQLRRLVNIVKKELEYLKLRGFSTGAARGIRSKIIVDYLREDLFNEMQQDVLWDSLGYGWTSDFALDVLNMTDTQTNTYMARIAQLTLGNVIALWYGPPSGMKNVSMVHSTYLEHRGTI